MSIAAENGSGTIGSTVAVGVVLTFVLLASHTLVQLHATSVLTAVGLHAARSVASDEVAHHDPSAMAAASRRAENEARSALGAMGPRARFRWDLTTTGLVRLRISGELPGVIAGLGTRWVDRWFSARAEGPT